MMTQGNTPQQNLIVCQFTRDCIEKKLLAPFLDYWAPHKLPRGSALRSLMNKVFFDIAGYDGPRAVCTIPEVRSFCQAFFEAWPFWFFAANLETPSLLIMVFACLRKLRVVDDEEEGVCRVKIDAVELDEFIERGLVAMECLCKQAGMSAAEMSLRSMQIIEYFQTDWSGRLSHPNDVKPETGSWN
jgi:hypothetical protein